MPVYDPETEEEKLPAHQQDDATDDTQETGSDNTSEMERNFDAPSATADDLPENHPHREDYGAGESTDDEQEDLYNPSKGTTKGKFRLTPLQKKGGIAGIFISLILALITTINMGPLQFIHLSKLLQRFHFSDQEDLKTSRMRKMYRYLRGNGVEDTKLGHFSNRYAIKVEKRMKSNGFELGYNRQGNLSTITIDSNKARGSPIGGELPNKDNKMWKHFSDIDGVRRVEKLSDGKWKVTLDPPGTKVRAKEDILKMMVRASGTESKTLVAIQARLLRIRGGVIKWHPIANLQQRAATKTDDILRQLASYAKGEFTKKKLSATGEKTQDADGNETSSPKADELAGDANGLIDDANNNPSKLKARLKTGGKVTGLAGILTGILCIVDAVSDNVDEINKLNILEPVMRYGMFFISTGDQIMSGQDVDMEALGQLNKVFHDDTTGSFTNSKSIQTNLGEDPKGAGLPKDAAINKDDSLVSEVLDKVPGLGPVCSTAGQWTVTAIDIAITAGTPGGALVQLIGVGAMEGIMRIFQDEIGGAFEALVNLIAGEPLDPTKYKGGQFGAIVDAGAFLGANESALASGGRPLTKAETASLSDVVSSNIAMENKNKSIFDKYFDVYDPDSAIAGAIDSQNPDMGKNIAKTPQKLFGFIKSIPNNLLNKKSYATASVYDYGLPKIGFSVNERDDTQLENPRENATEARKILLSSEGDKYKGYFMDCYGIAVNDDLTITNEQANITQYQGEEGLVKKHKEGKCGEDNDLKMKRIRMAIFDTKTMAEALCLEGDDEACDYAIPEADSGEGGSGADQTQTVNNNLYMVGDSYSEGLVNSAKLQDRLGNQDWEVNIDYKVGRDLSGGLTQLKKDEAKVSESGVVIVELGTNNYNDSAAYFNKGLANIKDYIKSKAPNSQIYWVNYAVRTGTEWDQPLQGKNELLKQFAERNNIKVINWAAKATNNDFECNHCDGLHMNPDGYSKLAKLIVNTVGSPEASQQINTKIKYGVDTSDVSCDSRTKDLGVTDGWFGGKKVRIRLCQVDNNPALDVNSQISTNIFEMYKAAKAAGVDLGTSSAYRSYQQQVETCAGATVACADPGFSMHQSGLAIDISYNGSTICYPHDSYWCRVRGNNPAFKWLESNANKYGLTNYSGEAWHWSTNGR
jgi:lysophospholipase L1-like esterase